MRHTDFTTAQAHEIMRRAAQTSLTRAHDAWALGIVDPMTLADGLGKEKRCSSLIDYIIRSDEGLGWSGRDPYRYNGDHFEWCGAFVAYCMPFVALELRRLYWSSTDRLNAYFQYKALFGTPNEKRVMETYKRKLRSELDSFGLDGLDPVYSRQYGVCTEHSREAPAGVLPGDIALFGAAKFRQNPRPFGTHVVLVDNIKQETATARASFLNYEGNAEGAIPGRPETELRPVQGIIHKRRPVGLSPGDSQYLTYHLRRWGRISFFDIDLALFERHCGPLP